MTGQTREPSPGARLESASLIDLQIAERRAQDRDLDAQPIGATDYITEDVVGLGRASRLDIVQHRRRCRGTFLGEKATVKVDQCRWRRVPFGSRDSSTFVERRFDKGGTGGRGGNLNTSTCWNASDFIPNSSLAVPRLSSIRVVGSHCHELFSSLLRV